MPGENSEIPEEVFVITESVIEKIADSIRGSDAEVAEMEFFGSVVFTHTQSNGYSMPICYTTQQILDSASSEDYAAAVQNNLFDREFVKSLRSDSTHQLKKENLIDAANDLDIIVPGETQVVLVAGNTEDYQYLKEQVEDDSYNMVVKTLSDAYYETCEDGVLSRGFE
ncbi:MAG: hypothetical protein BRC27_01690 [Nanohaloarchaea archaeon SW_10_44_10]|nr:MAG: hypothetical protein BRC27_01690 [Nanohaloarchaea archaeon SW_10_44_10]